MNSHTLALLAVGDYANYLLLAKPQYSVLLVTVIYHSGSLWVDEIQMIELDEIMRQRGDSAFRELLCRVRTADSVIKSREMHPDTPNYPTCIQTYK